MKFAVLFFFLSLFLLSFLLFYVYLFCFLFPICAEVMSVYIYSGRFIRDLGLDTMFYTLL